MFKVADCRKDKYMKTEYEYIVFVGVCTSAKRKTGVFSCRNKKGGDRLGIVKWYPGWRRYCFFPQEHNLLVFSEGCLRDIADFIKQLMDARKKQCVTCVHHYMPGSDRPCGTCGFDRTGWKPKK